jgi:hypothetical protein
VEVRATGLRDLGDWRAMWHRGSSGNKTYGFRGLEGNVTMGMVGQYDLGDVRAIGLRGLEGNVA